MSELLRNNEFVWAIMTALIFAITSVIKIPYKKLTGKIQNENTKKIANKAIIIFAFAIGFGLYFGYCHFFGMAFDLKTSVIQSMSAIVTHALLEKSKKAEDKVFDTEECQEIVEKAKQYVNDTSETTKSTDKKKAKSESAVADFWKSVKKK